MLSPDQIRDRIHQCATRAAEIRRRVPAQTQIALGLILAVLSFVAIYTALTIRDSLLHLRVQHSYRSAQIAVFVDDDSVYSGKLTGVVRKKLGLFGETLQGSFAHEIPISSGAHRVRVQITSGDGTVQQESVVGEFAKKGERTLLVNARGGDLALRWQDGGVSASDSSAVGTSSSSWISRYATTLIMTIAGSIVSALTGFALRELPGYLKSRQTTPE